MISGHTGSHSGKCSVMDSNRGPRSPDNRYGDIVRDNVKSVLLFPHPAMTDFVGARSSGNL